MNDPEYVETFNGVTGEVVRRDLVSTGDDPVEKWEPYPGPGEPDRIRRRVTWYEGKAIDGIIVTKRPLPWESWEVRDQPKGDEAMKETKE